MLYLLDLMRFSIVAVLKDFLTVTVKNVISFQPFTFFSMFATVNL